MSPFFLIDPLATFVPSPLRVSQFFEWYSILCSDASIDRKCNNYWVCVEYCQSDWGRSWTWDQEEARVSLHSFSNKEFKLAGVAWGTESGSSNQKPKIMTLNPVCVYWWQGNVPTRKKVECFDANFVQNRKILLSFLPKPDLTPKGCAMELKIIG